MRKMKPEEIEAARYARRLREEGATLKTIAENLQEKYGNAPRGGKRTAGGVYQMLQTLKDVEHRCKKAGVPLPGQEPPLVAEIPVAAPPVLRKRALRKRARKQTFPAPAATPAPAQASLPEQVMGREECAALAREALRLVRVGPISVEWESLPEPNDLYRRVADAIWQARGGA